MGWWGCYQAASLVTHNRSPLWITNTNEYFEPATGYLDRKIEPVSENGRQQKPDSQEHSQFAWTEWICMGADAGDPASGHLAATCWTRDSPRYTVWASLTSLPFPPLRVLGRHPLLSLGKLAVSWLLVFWETVHTSSFLFTFRSKIWWRCPSFC